MEGRYYVPFYILILYRILSKNAFPIPLHKRKNIFLFLLSFFFFHNETRTLDHNFSHSKAHLQTIATLPIHAALHQTRNKETFSGVIVPGVYLIGISCTD